MKKTTLLLFFLCISGFKLNAHDAFILIPTEELPDNTAYTSNINRKTESSTNKIDSKLPFTEECLLEVNDTSTLDGNCDMEANATTIESQVILSSSATEDYANVFFAVSNENFDSTPLINTNATSVTSGDWTFETNITSIFQSPNSTELATNLNSGTDRSLRFNAGGVNVSTFTIRTTDGSDFDLASMAINDILQTDFSIEGFRDGVSVVASELVDSDVSDTAGNIHYTFAATTASPNGGGSYGTLAFQSAYDNVDEIRITSAAATSAFDIDDIVATAAVSNTAPELGGTSADDTATEDVATVIDLSVYNIMDLDGDDPIIITLAVDRGTIASIDGNGTTAGVTIANTGTAFMTLLGSTANLNTYLNDTSKITYTTAANDTTTVVLTVTPNDGTVNGTSDTVNISISAVNDDPVISDGPDTAALSETNAALTTSGSLTVSDVDTTDTVSATRTLSVSGTSTSDRSDAAAPSDAELLSFLTVSPAAILDGTENSASLTWNFNSGTESFDYLAAGETLILTYTVSATDSAAGSDSETVTITITGSNDVPTDATLPSAVTVTEDTQSNIDLGATVFADVDSASITVTLTASAGTFASPADGSAVGSGVTETLQSATVITLVGSPADINAYLDTASNIQYTPASNVSGNAAATITVTMNDGDGSGNVTAGNVNVNVIAVNDAPTATGIPTDVTVTEDTASNVDLSAVTFADVDGNSLTVTLTATAGTWTASTGGDVTVDGSGTGTLTLDGTAANINTYLDTASNVQYTGASNANGNDAATFTIQANDGTVNPTLATVNLDITAVNDDPTDATLPSAVTVTEDTQSNIDIGTTVFADIDSANITVTLTATAGTFASPADGSAVGSGVTETLQSATVITLVGSPADINAYLDTASNIQYTPAPNVSGNAAATMVVTMNDGDGSGNVTAGNVNMNVTAVNDDPTGTLPASVTVTEDTQSNIALGAAVFADVDGDNITVTLTASAGTFAAPADGSGGGVTETLQSATVITLVGSAANINTYLDTASNIQYTAASNVTGNAAATITVTANDGAGSGDVAIGTVNINVTAVNDVPVFTNLDDTPTFTEGGSAQVLDANVTVADPELDALNGGAGNYNGAVLTIARNGGENTNDVFSAAGTLSALTEGVNFNVAGSVLGTVTTNSGGTLVLTFSDASVTPSTALVNSVLQQIAYANSSDNPAASVQLNWTFSDGNSGNAQGTGDNPGNGTGSTTVMVTGVNDNPTLTATGGNPTYTENGAAQDLFNTVTASTVEAADRFTSLSLTVTNVSDGASEILSFDGSDVALTNGNSVTTSTNNLSVSVSVSFFGSFGTATVSFTGATLTNAQMQTLIDALTYRNSSETPTTAGNRVVTITGISDNGGSANSGSDSTAPNLTSTVTVSAVNDRPILSDFGPDTGNIGYAAGSPTFVAFDSGIAANLQDTELDVLNTGAGNYNGATITLEQNGATNPNNRFGIAGGTTVLDNGSTVTVGATNIGTVTAGSAGTGTITITLNSSATSALVDTLFQSIGYTNANSSATGTVTIDVTFNDGNTGTQGSGGAQSITQQVNVTIGNPPVIGNLTGDTAAFTENGGVVIIDQGGDATVTDADSPANLNGGNLSISVTGNANAAQDVLSFSTVGTVALSGTTAGSNVSVGGVVVGTLANSIAAGNTLQVNLNTNATTANVQTLVQAATYNNMSEAPTTNNRTVSFVVTDNTGISSVDATTTVTIAALNDNPTITALPAIVTINEDTQSNIDLSSSVFTDLDSANITVTLTASAGTYATPADGASLGVTEILVSATVITLTGTPSDINTYLDTASNIQYTGALNINGNAAATITVTANDGNGSGDINLGTVSINIIAINDDPLINNLDADSFNYTEGDGAVVIDQGTLLTLSDVDSPNFNGGSLTVTITSGGDVTEDIVGLTTTGSVSLSGTTAGSNVSFGSSGVIGTLGNAIIAGNTLVINLNSNATVMDVQGLMRAVTYENLDTATATLGTRNVRFTLTDGDGGTSSNQDVEIFVNSSGPVAVCQNITVQLDASGSVTIAAMDLDGGSTDNVGITSFSVDQDTFGCSDIGTPVTVTLTVTNVGGLTDTCTTTVTVQDTLPPVITCPADQVVAPNQAGGTYTVPDYFALGDVTVIDNCTAPILNIIQNPAPGSQLSNGMYTVTFTSTDNQSNTAVCDFELTVDNILGVDQIEDIESLVLYPNPVKNIIYLSNPQQLSLKNLSIYDITGRLIRTVQLERMGTGKTIDISDLASTTYVAVITSERGQYTKSLIKE